MAKAMQPQKMRFSQAIQTPMYKNLVNNTLGDPARRFVLLGKHSGKIDIILHRNDCSIQDHFLHHIPDFLLMQAKLRYRYLLIEQLQR